MKDKLLIPTMKLQDKVLKLTIKLQTLLSDEEGQDLIEYALVVALIAFGAVTAMTLLSKDINKAFSTIGTLLTSSMAGA